MSAWIVSKKHIDALVTAAVEHRLVKDTPEARDAAGLMLWRENHRSVNARYGESTRTPSYSFTRREEAPVTVVKSIGCYEYQTCEHDGWTRSKARRLCVELKARVADEIVSATDAYNAAPWGL